jgi:hypothetical protein
MEHSQSNFGLDQCHDCGVRRKQVANPTTNYGFVLPTPTDLVTDLPADFDVALQGVDTRLKALQPGTTLGDLAYSSATANTNTVLNIGTDGQVLSVSSGVPAWTTAATTGLTFIASTSFSNVASQAFDSVFSATYRSYMIVINEIYAATGTDDLQLQFRYSTNQTQASLYYGAVIWGNFAGSTPATVGTSNGSALTIAEACGASSDKGAGYFYASQLTDKAIVNGMVFPGSSSAANFFGGGANQSRTYDGFLLKSSSSNITGRVTIYGLANA